MAVVETFARELETFERHHESLLRDAPGKFVLIRGGELAGVWDRYEDALKAGYERYKLNPFLVKRVERQEHAETFTRDPGPCQA